MSNPIGTNLHSDIPLEVILPDLERNHARVLVSLLMYGVLTALQEDRTTVDTAYRVVLNWPVFLYFRDKLKPRDRILQWALSYSIELGTLSRHFGEQTVTASCAEIRAKLAPWLMKHLGKRSRRSRVRSQTTILHADLPLVERVLCHLRREHARVLVTFLAHGTLTAVQEDLITIDVAKRVVLNEQVLLYLKQKLKPRDRPLEEVLSSEILKGELAD